LSLQVARIIRVEAGGQACRQSEDIANKFKEFTVHCPQNIERGRMPFIYIENSPRAGARQVTDVSGPLAEKDVVAVEKKEGRPGCHDIQTA
jgi:hypothetical protein